MRYIVICLFVFCLVSCDGGGLAGAFGLSRPEAVLPVVDAVDNGSGGITLSFSGGDYDILEISFCGVGASENCVIVGSVSGGTTSFEILESVSDVIVIAPGMDHYFSFRARKTNSSTGVSDEAVSSEFVFSVSTLDEAVMPIVELMLDGESNAVFSFAGGIFDSLAVIFCGTTMPDSHDDSDCSEVASLAGDSNYLYSLLLPDTVYYFYVSATYTDSEFNRTTVDVSDVLSIRTSTLTGADVPDVALALDSNSKVDFSFTGGLYDSLAVIACGITMPDSHDDSDCAEVASLADGSNYLYPASGSLSPDTVYYFYVSATYSDPVFSMSTVDVSDVLSIRTAVLTGADAPTVSLSENDDGDIVFGFSDGRYTSLTLISCGTVMPDSHDDSDCLEVATLSTGDDFTYNESRNGAPILTNTTYYFYVSVSYTDSVFSIATDDVTGLLSIRTLNDNNNVVASVGYNNVTSVVREWTNTSSLWERVRARQTGSFSQSVPVLTLDTFTTFYPFLYGPNAQGTVSFCSSKSDCRFVGKVTVSGTHYIYHVYNNNESANVNISRSLYYASSATSGWVNIANDGVSGYTCQYRINSVPAIQQNDVLYNAYVSGLSDGSNDETNFGITSDNRVDTVGSQLMNESITTCAVEGGVCNFSFDDNFTPDPSPTTVVRDFSPASTYIVDNGAFSVRCNVVVTSGIADVTGSARSVIYSPLLSGSSLPRVQSRYRNHNISFRIPSSVNFIKDSSAEYRSVPFSSGLGVVPTESGNVATYSFPNSYSYNRNDERLFLTTGSSLGFLRVRAENRDLADYNLIF